MTEKDTRYNGWTNYETWVVKLWIDNDRGDYEMWREATRGAWEQRNDPYDWENEHTTWVTPRSRTVDRLSESLKDHYENAGQDILDAAHAGASVWSDLLTSALQEVNWREIAENMIEDEDFAEVEADTK